MAVVAQRVEAGRPVSRLVSPVIRRVGAFVGALAAVCVLGVVLTMQSVADLTDRAEPAADAQRAVTQDMTDLQAAVSGWARSGLERYPAAFAETLARTRADLTELEGVADDTDALAATLTPQIAAARAWITGYAQPRMNGAPGPGNYNADKFERGETLLATYDRTRADADAAILDLREQASDAALLRLRLTIAAAVLVAGLAWIAIGRSRSKLLSELSEPLLALEKVVARMLKNDPEGRANQQRGPKEVRAIARALNDFAAAQSRARAVEGRIQDELHVLDSAKDDFVSNVSHELRTPLTTISGYLEMVADEFDGQLEPRHERMLEATRRNVTRLRALIDDLLALSKAEHRTTELEPSDVVEMVMDAVTDIRMTASRRGISVEVAAPDEAMLVVSDRAMLYRAFLNVLTNAVKFSHDDGAVEVTVKRVLNRVEVSVRDHGIGIPKAELDRLGTRFFRASNAMTNEIAGTGLGLRIVQTIIDKHAGDVIIESAEGEGTTVFIRLRLHGERIGRLPARNADATLDAGVDAHAQAGPHADGSDAPTLGAPEGSAGILR